MYGRITIEHTVWCGSCTHWQTFNERNRGNTARAARAVGWRLVKGVWKCEDCQHKGVRAALTEEATPDGT